jgi:hypothetical protein
VNTSTSTHDALESALREELRARTAPLVAPSAPFDRIDAAVRRDRLRRRTVAGTGLVLAGALVAVPAVLGALPGRSAAADVGGNKGGGGADVSVGGESPLLLQKPRGNLVGDAAFMRSATAVLNQNVDAREHATVLYANDDGTHTVVIGGSYSSLEGSTSAQNMFAVLVGPHDAKPSELEPDPAAGDSAQPVVSLSFVGEFTGSGKPVPYVVLGPTDLTAVQYATGLDLRDEDGKLTPVRTGVTEVSTADGTAAGEIRDPSSAGAAARLGMLLSFRGLSGGHTIDLDPSFRTLRYFPVEDASSAPYDAIRQKVANAARLHGIEVGTRGPGGDEVTDNAAQLLSDLALATGVDPGKVTVSVAWVGRETSNWDSALVELDAPGLPRIQAFVRGLAPGRPDSDAPSLAESFVRVAAPLTSGDLPTTAAAFGGTPEDTTFGADLYQSW